MIISKAMHEVHDAAPLSLFLVLIGHTLAIERLAQAFLPPHKGTEISYLDPEYIDYVSL